MELKGSKTERNLLTAFAGESQARNRYTYFASQAKKEGYVQIQSIFEETANQEKEHAKRLFKLLPGGKWKFRRNFRPGSLEPRRITSKRPPGERITSGRICIRPLPGWRGRRVLRKSPRFSNSIAVAEKQHERRYLGFLANIKNGTVFKKDKVVTWRCRNCGYLHEGREAPDKCLACDHPAGPLRIAVRGMVTTLLKAGPKAETFNAFAPALPPGRFENTGAGLEPIKQCGKPFQETQAATETCALPVPTQKDEKPARWLHSVSSFVILKANRTGGAGIPPRSGTNPKSDEDAMTETRDRFIQMLCTAQEMEEKGRAFYEKAMSTSENPLGKEIFRLLIDDEIVHLERIRKISDSLTKDQNWSEDWKKSSMSLPGSGGGFSGSDGPLQAGRHWRTATIWRP